MKRLIPQTLYVQTLLALLVGIALALGAGAWIYANARHEAVRTVGALGTAERIVNLVKLVNEVPSEWWDRILRGFSDASFRVTILRERPALGSGEAASHPAHVIAEFMRAELQSREVLVTVSGAQVPHFGPGFGAGPHGPMMHGGRMPGPMGQGPGALARAGLAWRGLESAIALDNGRWLHVATTLPDTGPTMSPVLLAALAIMAGTIALLTAWAVRRLTEPLSVLAGAAESLGRNVDAPPLAAAGSIEMRRASQAFNDMQARLKRLIENRTLMLAAISHDLRTQLTLLRLRAEAAEPPDNRERMLATISEMEEMLAATLAFARDEAANETRKRIDLSALVSSIVDDMADAGLAVAAGQSVERIETMAKPVALRRAVTNLIDNALKYAGAARVTLESGPAGIEIIVEDDGPGIPADHLVDVLQPFYRVEGSRSRDTGGIGLGLAITSSIAEAHGGKLSLANRTTGGLRAAIILPS